MTPVGDPRGRAGSECGNSPFTEQRWANSPAEARRPGCQPAFADHRNEALKKSVHIPPLGLVELKPVTHSPFCGRLRSGRVDACAAAECLVQERLGCSGASHL